MSNGESNSKRKIRLKNENKDQKNKKIEKEKHA